MKRRLSLFLGILVAASVAVQASERDRGGEVHYIDTRPPVYNDVVVKWVDANSKGGDAYIKPMETTSEVKVYYVAPEMERGDNQ